MKDSDHTEHPGTPDQSAHSGGWRAWAPGILLCFLIGMSSLFYIGNGFNTLYGPSKTERETKKNELRASRTRLMLQLSKCRNYGTMKSNTSLCGGSSLMYKSLESSLTCEIAEEVAKEMGITDANLSITVGKPLKAASGT